MTTVTAEQIGELVDFISIDVIYFFSKGFTISF